MSDEHRAPFQDALSLAGESQDEAGAAAITRLLADNKRERMGIEPTWRLFRRHTGFEAQGGHQSRVHSRRE